MNSYTIFPNEGGIACKIFDFQSPTPKFIVTQKEFDLMLTNFLNHNYKLKIGHDYIRLYGYKSVITVKDYKQIINHPILKKLKEELIRKISTDGYSTIQSKQPKHLKTKPNREKSNKNAGRKITKASKVTILSLLAISIITNNIISVQGNKLDHPIESQSIESSEIEQQDKIITYSNTPSTDLDERQRVSKKLEIKKAVLFDTASEIDKGYIEFEDLSDTKKAITTKENYYDLFSDCEDAYGIDQNLILGIATQERGVHSSTIDEGGAVGLMQIQYKVWLNEKLDYYEYNSETNTFEYHEMVITDAAMRDLENNIHIGSRILQKCLRMAEYNIPVAIQMYNQGYGAVKSIITTYAKENGKTYEDVISNPEDLGWLDYRYLKAGDPNYIENINKWLKENTFKIIHIKDLSVVTFAFENTKSK